MVQHLKQKVCELEEELSLVTGGQEREGELEETERAGREEGVGSCWFDRGVLQV